MAKVVVFLHVTQLSFAVSPSPLQVPRLSRDPSTENERRRNVMCQATEHQRSAQELVEMEMVEAGGDSIIRKCGTMSSRTKKCDFPMQCYVLELVEMETIEAESNNKIMKYGVSGSFDKKNKHRRNIMCQATGHQ